MAHPERRRDAVTPEHGGRFLIAGKPMAAEPEQPQHDDDPLESTELARRLRRMTWPPAPPEVKERVLERIIERSREQPDQRREK